ncbi:MAG: glutathione S-transferase N-terminal domain-containing protein [Glaciecola sp.]|nr:glutathione S-transferase N-terminal domain-containing protein [Glaciecola sp.]MDG1816663.1 glutathione S-transferase N-terminal domain-containing protein [Glaciecola sp.]MDG2098068.1 glutathione S-transferase N-terminal domain-containing protein [Glaciecola sp.]
MGVVISLIRNGIGGILVFFDIITRGTKLKRSPQAQQHVQVELEALSLYQFFACPFCIKTRRKMYKLNLPIKTLSAAKGSPHREALLNGGGKIQTPCLRIEQNGQVQWLYESSAIITYLEKRFT